MIEKLERLLKEATAEVDKASEKNLDDLRYKYLGRKGKLAEIMHNLAALKLEERKKAGAKANETRAKLEALFLQAKKSPSLGKKPVDVTSPGKSYQLGHLHPVTQVLREALAIFRSLGYEVVEGPEVEDEWHNFEALNIPAEHPARDMQDTFYLEGGLVLRTHTSSVQIRYMEHNPPPIKIVSPGKVYRSENEDASHSLIFNQIEGLAIDKNITFADLKGTLEVFIKEILGEDTKTRFR